MGDQSDIFNQLEDLQRYAKSKGADEVLTYYKEARDLEVTAYNGQLESFVEGPSYDFTVEVTKDGRTAESDTAEVDIEKWKKAVDKAMDKLKQVDPNPDTGMLSPEEVSTTLPDPDIYDPEKPSVEALADLAIRSEEAGLAVEGITQCESAQASWHSAQSHLLLSNGFQGSKFISHSSFAPILIAKKSDGNVNQGYEHEVKTHFEDLRKPEDIAASAAKYTLELMDARPIKTADMPIIFSPRETRKLIKHLLSAINAGAVAEEVSFYKNALGKQVINPSLTIIDDPTLDRMTTSRRFDFAGVAASRQIIINEGTIERFITGVQGSRKLLRKRNIVQPNTGHTSVALSPYVQAGTQSPEDLVSSVKRGFYVSESMSPSLDLKDGSLSVGVNGLLIENGQIQHAVRGVTIAGNLKDIFAEIIVADDVDYKNNIITPTAYVPKMTLSAG